MVADGGKYFSQKATEAMMTFSNHKPPPLFKITPSEKVILCLIAQGLTNQQIADKLIKSIHTIETHRKNIMSKTGCKNAVELTNFALENKICL